MVITMKNVTILPESDDVLACVRYSNVITMEDYEPFIAKLKENLARSGKLKILVIYDDNFQGWEMDAADSNFRSILEYAPEASKIAYVNPPENKILQMRLSSPLLKGEIRFFSKDEEAKAFEWIRSDDAT